MMTSSQTKTIFGIGHGTFCVSATFTALLAAGSFYLYSRKHKLSSLFFREKRIPSSSSPVQNEKKLYKETVVKEIGQFDPAVSLALAEAQPGQRVFILVEASRDATGQSWCPDCNQALPIIEQAFTSNADTVFVVRAEVDRVAWKSPTLHPYRTHPLLVVQRLPTLYRLCEGRVEAQLIETECHNSAQVQKFVANV